MSQPYFEKRKRDGYLGKGGEQYLDSIVEDAPKKTWMSFLKNGLMMLHQKNNEAG